MFEFEHDHLKGRFFRIKRKVGARIMKGGAWEIYKRPVPTPAATCMDTCRRETGSTRDSISYGYNGWSVGWHQAGTYHEWFQAEKHTMDSIDFPLKTVAFADSTGNAKHRRYGPRYSAWLARRGYGVDVIRHKRGATLVFVDGHAVVAPMDNFFLWYPGVPNPIPYIRGDLDGSPAGYL